MKKNITFIIQTLSVAFFAMLSGSVQAQNVGDQITTVADLGTSGMYVATLCPDHDVAIDKDAAEVFTIYSDEGYPNLLKMRLRNGKYIIKAGDHAVIKTIGEMTVTLEETNKESSAFMDDVICPSENILVKDFVKTHPLGEDERLYMLTNLERNGGFGFTYFTGTTMRKGCYFIVSTVEPETTDISAATRASSKVLSSSDDAIYDITGQRVAAPRAGKIYIQGGKKFLSVSDDGVERLGTRAPNDLEDGDPIPFLTGEAGNDDGFITLSETSEVSLVRGDANSDGEVNSVDVNVISDHIMGKPTEAFFMEAADVNEDETINVADIVGTLRIILDKAE